MLTRDIVSVVPFYNAELPAVVELYSPPWHTVFFSLGGMRQLFARNGFELLEVRFTPSGRKGGGWGALQAILERINRERNLGRGGRKPGQVAEMAAPGAQRPHPGDARGGGEDPAGLAKKTRPNGVAHETTLKG